MMPGEDGGRLGPDHENGISMGSRETGNSLFLLYLLKLKCLIMQFGFDGLRSYKT